MNFESKNYAEIIYKRILKQSFSDLNFTRLLFLASSNQSEIFFEVAPIWYSSLMSIWYQALIVFGLTLLVMGYFQYRRSADVVAIIQEMFRPTYLVPAILITICYVVVKVVFSFLGRFL